MRSFPSKTLSARPHHKAIAVVRLFAVFFCLLILQMISPLCSEMKHILQEYLRIRKGTENDYLFPNEFNGQMSENCLVSAIQRYNRSRGVTKTSIHLFRHTFARKYLLDCGGNAFTLQKLLGHSTLEMTRKYCELFNADIVRDYDSHLPLSSIVKPKKSIKMN